MLAELKVDFKLRKGQSTGGESHKQTQQSHSSSVSNRAWILWGLKVISVSDKTNRGKSFGWRLNNLCIILNCCTTVLLHPCNRDGQTSWNNKQLLQWMIFTTPVVCSPTLRWRPFTLKDQGFGNKGNNFLSAIKIVSFYWKTKCIID